MGIRGLDSKERLEAFFEAKGHVNLVMRIVDVIELRNVYQDYLIEKSARILGSADRKEGETRKAWLLKTFPRGWVVLSIKLLLAPMGLREVERLQAIVYAYADIRRQKGEPHRSEPCPRCNGLGRSSGTICKDCQGDGSVITFIEVSPEEKILAEGGAV